MSVRIVTAAEARRLLPVADCIEVMRAVFETVARGDVVQPLRSMVWMPDKSGLLGVMPGYTGAPRALGIKVVSVMPGNHGTPFDSHQGVVLVFETANGCLRAVVDASSITSIRTAAVSGLATRLMARADAGDLAILGSGVQAASHVDAMRAARPLRRVRVWSRSARNARAFAERASKRLGLRVEACDSARAAVEGADLICTTTASRTPVLEGGWLAPGAHINAVGACFPDGRELDTAAVARARLVVDRRESTLRESGDFLIPKAEGAFGDEHIVAELGDVVLGTIPGRTAPDQVTLFKSLGIAVEDIAAAHAIGERAAAAGAGIELEMGGRRDDGEAAP